MLFELHDKSPPYSHYKFIRYVCLDWIDPEKYCPEPTPKRSPAVKYSTSTKSIACNNLKFKPKKKASLTDKTLDPYNGSLCC